MDQRLERWIHQSSVNVAEIASKPAYSSSQAVFAPANIDILRAMHNPFQSDNCDARCFFPAGLYAVGAVYLVVLKSVCNVIVNVRRLLQLLIY